MSAIIKLNVFNNPIELCSEFPLTGFYRDGCCNSSKQDSGEHQICSIMDDDFLNFQYKKGNDLITPNELFGFPGLKPGNKWCVCTNRWLEAFDEGIAPKILVKSTNKLVLNKIDLEILKKFALDIN
tara:strand:- start:432 stop:809 length:378 start_codon:yes stop_codon:yes gene_type:complete